MVKESIGIYFASQTGTAENFANTMKHEAENNDLKAEVYDLAEVTEISFKKHKFIIMMMATHYEGNSPDNAAEFWKWFSREEEIGNDWLLGYKFTVFALGDNTYENFARIGKETDRLLEKYGATRAFQLGVGSDDEGFISKYFKAWKKDIWPVLVKEFAPSEKGMDEEGSSSEEPVQIPFNCIISSFTQEKSVADLRKLAKEFSFKAENYLNHQTLKISKRDSD